MMSEYFPLYVYFALVFVVTAVTVGATALFASNRDTPVKFMPYESGMQRETRLLHERFPLRHYLVALMFLIFDVEVIFLYPWAVVAKSLGAIAFVEITLFLAALSVGLAYVWRKGGLQWQ
jgi:NADH:ubiquinone oxidoreductase subunit 3 (subunit A)